MEIRRLQHVSVPRPAGAKADRQAIDFYAGVLGLKHVPAPRTFEGQIEVTWFRLGETEIHVYAASPGEKTRDSGAHFCLEVTDTTLARQTLEAAGYRCEDALAIPMRPRFYTWDPFGNSIEVTQVDGDYMAEDGEGMLPLEDQ
jgi:catechol 2,3-dioxygenase-like lactoylglutathione lyase family enzyme